MNHIIQVLLALSSLAVSDVVVLAIPPNDRCIDSITLTMGEKVGGDNSDANFDYNNQGVCGSRSDRRAVWYEINGIGKEVTINICTNNEKLTDFGVFQACNTQKCHGAPEQQRIATNCEAEESNEYKFMAGEGKSYYVHVRSDVLFEGEGSNFTIWYTEPTDEPTAVPMTEEPVPSVSASNSSTPISPSETEKDSATSLRHSSSIVFYSIIISSIVFAFMSLFQSL